MSAAAELRTKRERLMSALLVSSSIVEAADLANIPISSAYKIARDDDFRDEMRRHRQALIDASVVAAGSHIGTAFSVLVSIMNDGNEKSWNRLAAADKLLIHAASWIDRSDVLDRLDRLEAAGERYTGSALDAVGNVLKVTQ